MTDPLISEYLPVVNGHIVKNYRWMETRGNCLLTVDDLKQIAAIALVKRVTGWDEHLETLGKSREGNGGLFWWYLKEDIKHAVFKYYERVAHADRPANSSVEAIEDNPGEYGPDIRTALRAPTPKATWGVVHERIVEHFEIMPTRDKLLIALRYFDDLPWKEAADILGANHKTTTNLTLAAINRWRTHARNQYVTDATSHEWAAIPRRLAQPWEIPGSLTEYIETRYRVDVPTYIWFVTACIRTDPTYLVDILGSDRQWSTAAMGHRSKITPAQAREIDHMLGQGFKMTEIAQQLDVPYSSVVWRKNRDAA